MDELLIEVINAKNNYLKGDKRPMSDLIQKDHSSAKDRSTAVCVVLVIDSGSY